MRILAFSDLHRNKDIAQEILRASHEADVVVGAGDFATKGVGLSETIDVLRSITVPTIFVAGNHDSLAELQDACRGRDTIHVLHGEGVTIAGIAFFGLGFETPPGRNEPWNQSMGEVEAAKALTKCPKGAILVTHSPPFGVADVQTTGVHEGSRSIREAVETPLWSHPSLLGDVGPHRPLPGSQSRSNRELVRPIVILSPR
jgi:Icc-related predicted phosphoesterase